MSRYNRPGRGSDTYGSAQSGGACSRIARDLVRPRADRTARQHGKRRRRAARRRRQMARSARHRAAAAPQEGFDPDVFERMEGDDGEPSARLQQAFGGNQAAVELAELVIDRDAQGLKGAGGRIEAGLALRDRGAYDIGELAGAAKGARRRAATIARATRRA